MIKNITKIFPCDRCPDGWTNGLVCDGCREGGPHVNRHPKPAYTVKYLVPRRGYQYELAS